MIKDKKNHYLSAPKRKLKDSIFRRLFSSPGYLRELYLSLNGEDTGVREDELAVVYSENIFCNGIMNHQRPLIHCEKEGTLHS